MANLADSPFVQLDSTQVAVNAPVSTVLWTQVGVDLNFLKAALPKAWVSFNQTGGIGDSTNVSGVSHDGTGFYTVTFTVAIGNANYAIFATGNDLVETVLIGGAVDGARLTTSVQVSFKEAGATVRDVTWGSVLIFSNA